ncbi:hypothetical protein DM992_36250 [Burkholderia sp. JP2-270]|nr:hypothetical protein DM992_36250 [Burkholderia sp. JP2-270]
MLFLQSVWAFHKRADDELHLSQAVEHQRSQDRFGAVTFNHRLITRFYALWEGRARYAENPEPAVKL